MRKLLAQWLMKRLWKLALCQDDRYGTIGARYNMVNLIPTILGGDSSWEPWQVRNQFESILEWRARLDRINASKQAKVEA